MRYLWIGCLFVHVIGGSCFGEINPDHWFKTSKERENQDSANKEDNALREEAQKIRDKLKEILREGEERASKGKEELEKAWREKQEKRHQIEEKGRKLKEEVNKNMKESHQSFHENFNKKAKKFDERFEKNWEEFHQMHKQRMEEIQKERKKQEQAETDSVNDQAIQGFIQSNSLLSQTASESRNCLTCSFDDWTALFDYQVFVFMSFSVPDAAWISLSKELEQVGGVFVLRGLPGQSFQTLASRTLHLKEKGVKAPIQLDPQRFLAYQIDQVPSIVVAEDQIFDKLSGNVSLCFALQRMAESGETKMAKTLHHLLEKQSWNS